MTLEEARRRVEEIRRQDAAGDHEGAHACEDALMRDVLRAVVAGARNARRLAEVALSTEDDDEPRWFA